MDENQGHLYNHTGETPESMIAEIVSENYPVKDLKNQ